MSKKVRFTYNDVNTVTNDLIESIRIMNDNRGYDRTDNAHYTLGYIQSLLNNLIADMPVTKQHQIISDLAKHTESKLNKAGV